jgi:hypothetical protein
MDYISENRKQSWFSTLFNILKEKTAKILYYVKLFQSNEGKQLIRGKKTKICHQWACFKVNIYCNVSD